jgi:hypothetical protein
VGSGAYPGPGRERKPSFGRRACAGAFTCWNLNPFRKAVPGSPPSRGCW